MPPLVLPTADEVQRILRGTTSRNSGLGIIDTRNGRVHLSAASDLDGGDHATLVMEALRIYDRDKALHVRGFVVAVDKGQWHIVNISGLNPLQNKMEPELFAKLESMLMPLLGACPQE